MIERITLFRCLTNWTLWFLGWTILSSRWRTILSSWGWAILSRWWAILSCLRRVILLSWGRAVLLYWWRTTSSSRRTILVSGNWTECWRWTIFLSRNRAIRRHSSSSHRDSNCASCVWVIIATSWCSWHWGGRGRDSNCGSWWVYSNWWTTWYSQTIWTSSKTTVIVVSLANSLLLRVSFGLLLSMSLFRFVKCLKNTNGASDGESTVLRCCWTWSMRLILTLTTLALTDLSELSIWYWT